MIRAGLPLRPRPRFPKPLTGQYVTTFPPARKDGLHTRMDQVRPRPVQRAAPAVELRPARGRHRPLPRQLLPGVPVSHAETGAQLCELRPDAGQGAGAEGPMTGTTAIAIQDIYPENVAHCYGCGRLNDQGLQIKSYDEGDDDRLPLRAAALPYGGPRLRLRRPDCLAHRLPRNGHRRDRRVPGGRPRAGQRAAPSASSPPRSRSTFTGRPRWAPCSSCAAGRARSAAGRCGSTSS